MYTHSSESERQKLSERVPLSTGKSEAGAPNRLGPERRSQKMKGRITFLLGMALLFGGVAFAQDDASKAEVSIDYSLVRFYPAPSCRISILLS
jgi:hypothetical protein